MINSVKCRSDVKRKMRANDQIQSQGSQHWCGNEQFWWGCRNENLSGLDSILAINNDPLF